jgi:hypothetical protein
LFGVTVNISEGGTVAGTVYAYTTNSQGYRDEVYNNHYRDQDLADPIPVTLAGGASGINFALDVGGNITGTSLVVGERVHGREPAPGGEGHDLGSLRTEHRVPQDEDAPRALAAHRRERRVDLGRGAAMRHVDNRPRRLIT